MRRVVFIVLPGYSVINFAAVSVFETANQLQGEALYDLRFVSAFGGGVQTSSGMRLETEPFVDNPGDTLVVGGTTVPEPQTMAVIDFVRSSPAAYRRVAGLCTGAFVLAEAGLLDGRRATTHWLYSRELQKRFPRTKIEEDTIFVNDGQVWTSAGMTAGMDLALALVEDDLGNRAAQAVARKMVFYNRRGGGQSQFSTLLDLSAPSDRIQAAVAYARENLHLPLTVAQLADAVHLSPRQFSRVFHAETGRSPAKAIESLRVEEARTLIEQSSWSIDEVASQTGFSDRDQMRRAFLRAFGQSPQVLRRNARRAALDWRERVTHPA